MEKHELKQLGVPDACLDVGVEFCKRAERAGVFREKPEAEVIQEILDRPEDYLIQKLYRRFASAVIEANRSAAQARVPYRIWGQDQIEAGAIEQLLNACKLPVSARAALMPDAHVGYGLPIGGVLGTLGAVIPYAVGVDIACRMKLTVLDVPGFMLQKHPERFEKALRQETLFGAGNAWKTRRTHGVMDMDWDVSPVTKQHRDKAWGQLGTSGGGNHFVEFGTIRFNEPLGGVEVGKEYVAVLSHSGSRGVGALVCQYYSQLARKLLPRGQEWAGHLAWLEMDKAEGQEYWAAMTLMGEYARANHDVIHRHIVANLGDAVALQVENHHNFAWKEKHGGTEMIVHRKGATPAGPGMLGVIPGSMADPAYVVRGLGEEESLQSAAHGAGRKLARAEAKRRFAWDEWRPVLRERGVKLLSAGLDEVPGVYKDIDEVMARQSDLVEKVARFEPRIVRMAEDGSLED